MALIESKKVTDAQWVRRIMRKNGINQSELARRIGVTPGAARRWQTGENRISPRSRRLIELLLVNVEKD